MSINVVISGVGGQGNVLASRILAKAAMEYGLPVLTSEVIGMAQREGVVMSQVRMGEGNFGALIPDGGADILLGFELAETVRWLKKLKKDGVVITNTAEILPVTASLGLCQYDAKQLTSFLVEKTKTLYMFDATSLAKAEGTYKATNIVMLGALAQLNLLPFSAEHLRKVMLDVIPAKLHDINLRAFDKGGEAIEGAQKHVLGS